MQSDYSNVTPKQSGAYEHTCASFDENFRAFVRKEIRAVLNENAAHERDLSQHLTDGNQRPDSQNLATRRVFCQTVALLIFFAFDKIFS